MLARHSVGMHTTARNGLESDNKKMSPTMSRALDLWSFASYTCCASVHPLVKQDKGECLMGEPTMSTLEQIAELEQEIRDIKQDL